MGKKIARIKHQMDLSCPAPNTNYMKVNYGESSMKHTLLSDWMWLSKDRKFQHQTAEQAEGLHYNKFKRESLYFVLYIIYVIFHTFDVYYSLFANLLWLYCFWQCFWQFSNIAYLQSCQYSLLKLKNWIERLNITGVTVNS